MAGEGAQNLEHFEDFTMPEATVYPATTKGSVVTIAVAGALDMATIDLVERHIQHALSCVNHSPPARLVLDLNKVTFMGSAGLHLLLGVRATVRELGTQLVLRGAGRPVIAQPLRVTGLLDLFVIE